MVQAMYTFAAQDDDELSFQAGDWITILDKSNSSWWKGQVHGYVGIFPRNYVSPPKQRTMSSWNFGENSFLFLISLWGQRVFSFHFILLVRISAILFVFFFPWRDFTSFSVAPSSLPWQVTQDQQGFAPKKFPNWLPNWSIFCDDTWRWFHFEASWCIGAVEYRAINFDKV